MNSKIFFLLIISVILIVGCNKKTEITEGANDASMTGYVVKTKDSRILVVADIEPYEAVWVSSSDKVKIGQKINVTFKGEIQTSDPAQGLAKEIRTVKIDSPEKSKLSPVLALEKALQSINDWEVPVVKRIFYREEDHKWEIVLFDKKNKAMGEKQFLIDDID